MHQLIDSMIMHHQGAIDMAASECSLCMIRPPTMGWQRKWQFGHG
jgi:hypothetical protein